MQNPHISLPILFLAVAIAGCSTSQTMGGGSSAQAFTGNAAAGRPVSAAIVEAMSGGLVGGRFGTALEGRELRQALEAEYRALEYTPAGEMVAWGQKGSRRYGEVVAGSPYRVGSQDCRQYVHTVFASGQAQAARGTACRNADGSWTPLA